MVALPVAVHYNRDSFSHKHTAASTPRHFARTLRFIVGSADRATSGPASSCRAGGHSVWNTNKREYVRPPVIMQDLQRRWQRLR